MTARRGSVWLIKPVPSLYLSSSHLPSLPESFSSPLSGIACLRKEKNKLIITAWPLWLQTKYFDATPKQSNAGRLAGDIAALLDAQTPQIVVLEVEYSWTREAVGGSHSSLILSEFSRKVLASFIKCCCCCYWPLKTEGPRPPTTILPSLHPAGLIGLPAP